MANDNEKTGPGRGINEFVQKNRKPIIACFSLLGLAMAAFIISLVLIDQFNKRAIHTVEELNRRYEALRFGFNEDSSAAEVETLLTDLNAFAAKSSGYAGGRAWSLVAGIHADRKNWAEAEKASVSAAQTAAKTYLAPAAWFNAAMAAEEQDKKTEALEYYASSVSLGTAFPAAPQAQFAIGRIKESLNDTSGAIEAYREIISKWPYNTVFSNFAYSRIIALETAVN